MCTGGQKSEVDLKNPIRSKTPPTNYEARISTICTVECLKCVKSLKVNYFQLNSHYTYQVICRETKIL